MYIWCSKIVPSLKLLFLCVCASLISSGCSEASMPRTGAILLVLTATMLAQHCANSSYIDPGDDDIEVSGPDYGDDPNDLQVLQDVGKRSSLIYVFRRACIRRGGNCDHRPGDCCHSSSCRCNLWGSNCRCQRMGLFQKWG